MSDGLTDSALMQRSTVVPTGTIGEADDFGRIAAFLCSDAAKFVNGMRVTDEPTIAIVKKTLDEVVNRDVCEAIEKSRGRPKGMPGDSVLVCEKLNRDDDGNPVDLGFVGDVTEVKVKLIKKEIADGFIPVISPVAEGLDNKPYNINADVAAGRVASALRARRLVYMSDVPGLLANPADPESLISISTPIFCALYLGY